MKHFTKRIHITIFLILSFTFSSIAQENFELRYQHNGRYDFTMIGASFNAISNGDGTVCDGLDLPFGTLASADLNLAANQNIVAAYLFWSSNVTLPDSQVRLNGTAIQADDTYTDAFNVFDFSGAVADVTDFVTNTGNATYTVEDLAISRFPVGTSGCSTSYGGWSMLVVYEDAALPLNSVNVYYGFRGISTNSGRGPITIDINDLLIANDIGSFLGILAWEGDQALGGGPNTSEIARFNGNLLGNNLNPTNNVFNETNSFSGQTNFRNMDMDRFEIDDFVNIGDMDAEIYVESQQDLVIMNVIAFTLGNELPEPTVEITNAESGCNDGQIQVDFDVRNFNANDELPTGTSVKFYINQVDATPDLEVFTNTTIPIGGTETLNVSLPIPPGTPNNITIFATVNLDNAGNAIILELNSNNNRDSHEVDVAPDPQIPIQPVGACDEGNSIASFDIDAIISAFEMDNPNFSVTIHESPENAENNIDAMTGLFQNTTNPDILYAREVDETTGCIGVVAFELVVNDNPQSANTSLQACSSDGSATFTLSDANNSISNENNITVSYFDTPTEAQLGNSPLPNNYLVNGNTTVYGRVEFNDTGCFSVAELELIIIENPEDIPLEDEMLCDESDMVAFDLTTKLPEILGSQDPTAFTVSFHNNIGDADTGDNPIANPSGFTTNTNPQNIFVRIGNNNNTDCYQTQDFSILINRNPPANDIPISIPTCSNSNSVIFDLTTVALEVADGNPNMVVDFFEDFDLQQPILDPSNYASQGTFITVYGRVTDPATGCFSVGEVLLEILANPEQRNQSLIECATDDSNTEAVFDLTVLTADIIGNAPNVTVSFHVSQIDADSPNAGGLNPITDPNNFNSATATIYARSEANYQGTMCHSISEISLQVNPRPTIIETTYSLCNLSDRADFDLDSRIGEITDNATNVDVSFYEDQALQNQITNTTAYNSTMATIYVYVIDQDTNCEEVGELHLAIEPIPEIEAITANEECLQNGVATFDLTVIGNDLINENPNLEFDFYEDQALTQEINTPNYVVDQTTTIYLQFNNTGSDCINSTTIELPVSASPVIDYGDIVICLSNGYTLPDGNTVFESGFYEILIQDPATGCDTITRTNLIVGDIEFPTAFAPNGNGNNESFGAIPGEECVGEVTNFHLVVFNRWGEKVFETSNFVERWDGYYKGETQDGTFLWSSTYTFQEVDVVRSGTVILIY